MVDDRMPLGSRGSAVGCWGFKFVPRRSTALGTVLRDFVMVDGRRTSEASMLASVSPVAGHDTVKSITRGLVQPAFRYNLSTSRQSRHFPRQVVSYGVQRTSGAASLAATMPTRYRIEHRQLR